MVVHSFLLDSGEWGDGTVVTNTLVSTEERLAKRKRNDDDRFTTKDICCDFVLDASTEAEMLFCLANFVMA